METDKKSKRSKLVYGAVIGVLILFFIVGFVYGLNSVLKMEGNFPPVVLAEGKTPPPQTAEEAVAFLNRVVAEAKAEKPKFSSDAWFDIDADSLETSASNGVKESLLYVKDGVSDHLNASFEKKEADFAEGFDDALRVPALSAKDVNEFTCDYVYYRCVSCGETSGEPQPGCEACGSEYPYQMQYRDEYTITYVLNVSDQVLKKNFTVRSDEEILALFGDEAADVLTLNGVEPSYSALTVRIQVSRVTDELKNLTFIKEMPVHVSAAFKIIPDRDLDFTVNVSETERYSFTWPNISLSAHSKDMEPKETDNLLSTLTFPDPSQDNVIWTSSDETVVAVDEEGYLKSGKETGSAVITASYEFNGKTYTDSCTVNVKYDVESVSLNKRKVSLKAGDTFTLTAQVAPKKASIKTVTWYSENEEVASVDENGVVTAVAPGVVTVYALSDDLYYKASCEVTVK